MSADMIFYCNKLAEANFITPTAQRVMLKLIISLPFTAWTNGRRSPMISDKEIADSLKIKKEKVKCVRGELKEFGLIQAEVKEGVFIYVIQHPDSWDWPDRRRKNDDVDMELPFGEISPELDPQIGEISPELGEPEKEKEKKKFPPNPLLEKEKEKNREEEDSNTDKIYVPLNSDTGDLKELCEPARPPIRVDGGRISAWCELSAGRLIIPPLGADAFRIGVTLALGELARLKRRALSALQTGIDPFRRPEHTNAERKFAEKRGGILERDAAEMVSAWGPIYCLDSLIWREQWEKNSPEPVRRPDGFFYRYLDKHTPRPLGIPTLAEMEKKAQDQANFESNQAAEFRQMEASFLETSALVNQLESEELDDLDRFILRTSKLIDRKMLNSKPDFHRRTFVKPWMAERAKTDPEWVETLESAARAAPVETSD